MLKNEMGSAKYEKTCLVYKPQEMFIWSGSSGLHGSSYIFFWSSNRSVKHKCYKELGYTNICEGTENFKTIKRIQRLSHWLNWRKTLKNVSGNALCQTHNYSILSPTGLLQQPIPLPTKILFGLYGYHRRSSKIRKSECNLRDENMLS